ncbi:MAG TPA: hypothetical protein VML96_09815 [Egibacteraceae bacterium]|nr:hypothetical protein [Egibacteraceae bacterium]
MNRQPRILSEHNILATFGDKAGARAAMEQLETGGVDAASISLHPDDEAVDDRNDTQVRDREVAGKGLRTAAGGMIIGAVVGALLGVLGGLIAFGDPTEGLGVWGTVAFALGGAAAGAGVGLIAAGAGRMKQSQAWESSWAPTGGGEFVVGVHSETRDEIARAEEVLAERNPLTLRRVDADGRDIDGE